jgi:hypothetical protein
MSCSVQRLAGLVDNLERSPKSMLRTGSPIGVNVTALAP